MSVTKGGTIIMRRLSDQSVLDIVRRLARHANIPRFSPHDARRTFIGDMLDLGVDISTVQQLAGHAQVTTTARYDRSRFPLASPTGRRRDETQSSSRRS